MARIGRSLAVLALLLAACGGKEGAAPAAAQKRDILEVDRASSFSVSPSGELWICARDGKSYVSRDWNQTWCQTILPAHTCDEGTHLWFFDERRAMLPGLTVEGGASWLLLTEDGGLEWNSIALPSKGPILDVQIGKDGTAWASSASGALLETADFGHTWRVVSEPFESPRPNAPDGSPAVTSFFFLSSGEGYAGSHRNGLEHTSDGGKTWIPLSTPADELCPPNPEVEERGNYDCEPMTGKDGRSIWQSFHGDQAASISSILVFGDQLLVLQCGQVFIRPLSARDGWKLLEVDGCAVTLAALDGERLAVATSGRAVGFLAKELRPLPGLLPALPDRPDAIGSCSKGLALLAGVIGQVCSVCTLTGGRLECSHLHTAGPSHDWKIDSFDRTSDGTLYGVTANALYRSKDCGKSWELLAEGKYLSCVRAHADGKGVLVQDEDGWYSWCESQPCLLALRGSASPPRDSSIDARNGRLWIATAFEAAKDRETQRMLRSSDTVLAGPNFTATVFASADDGHTWQSIDRYVGGIVRASWLGKDGSLSLCMTDGSIRRGSIDPATGRVRSEGMQRVSADGVHMGNQYASWLIFPEPNIGWVGGFRFFGGVNAAHSEDGGRSWKAAETVEDGYIKTFLLGGGSCVRMVGAYDQPCRIEIWRDGKFETICHPEYGPHDAFVDSTGALLVRLVNADVWSLDRDGKDWKKLGNIEFPGR